MQQMQRKRTFKLVAAAATATIATMVAVGAQPATAAPVDHPVGTSGDTFTPSTLPGSVAVGDTVTFSGLGGHNATSTTGSAATFASPAGAATYVFTAKTAGKYTYECTFHSGMTGSFTVGAAGAAPAAPAAAVPVDPAAAAPADPAAAAPVDPAAPAAAAPVDPAAAPAADPAAAAPADPAAAAPSGASASGDDDDEDGDDHGDDDGDDDGDHHGDDGDDD